MQKNVIKNEFIPEDAPLATIQPGMAIDITLKGANDLYLDLNNSRIHVLAKITKADETNIDANTAAPIYLTLHSMFCEISLELNNRNASEMSQLYPYCSHLETRLNFCKETRNSSSVRRINKGHHRAHGCHRSQLKQCLSERSSRDNRIKYRGRAHQLTSPGRVQPRTPYLFIH